MNKHIWIIFAAVNLLTGFPAWGQLQIEAVYDSGSTNRQKCGISESEVFQTNCCPPLNRYFKQYLQHVEWNCTWGGWADGIFQVGTTGTAEYDRTLNVYPSNSCVETCTQSGWYQMSNVGGVNFEGTSTNCDEWTIKNSDDGTALWGGETGSIDSCNGFGGWDFAGYMSWGGTWYDPVGWWDWDSINVTFQCGASPERDEVDTENPYGYNGSATHTYNKILSSEYPTIDLLQPFPVDGESSSTAWMSIAGDQSSASMVGTRVKFKFTAPQGKPFTVPYVIHFNVDGVDVYETNTFSGVGTGTDQEYPSGESIALNPPYMNVPLDCGDYYVGGSASIGLLGWMCVTDEKDGGSTPVQCKNCCLGMPKWWVTEPYINLWASDRPVEYTTSLGEKIGFDMYYKQRDTRPMVINGQAPYLPNNGWNNNWSSYVHFTDRPVDGGSGGVFSSWTATVYMPGGGEVTYADDQPSDATSGDRLLRTSSNGFRLVHPDGSQEIYGLVTPAYPLTSQETVPIMEDAMNVAGGLPLQWSSHGIWQADGVQYESITPVNIGSFGTGISVGAGGVTVTGTNHMTLNTNWQNQVMDGVTNWGVVTVINAVSADAILTEHVDPYGNIIHFYYNNNGGSYQLQSVVDYDSQITTLTYTNGYISAVNMPYGRTASFHYAANTNAQLLSVTDAQGMTSSFSYGADGFLSSMTTPYGTNGFTHFETNGNSVAKWNDGVTRAILVGNPDGSQELYAFYNRATNSAPASYSSDQVPAGYGNIQVSDTGQNATDETGRMYMRNSFYWGKKQCAALPGLNPGSLNSLGANDFLLARMSHWLLDAQGVNLTGAASLTRDPSPDGTTPGQLTWYVYPNSWAWYLYGGDEKAGWTFRLMPDGTTWHQQTAYNGYAQPTYIGTSANNYDGSVGTYSSSYYYSDQNYSQTYPGWTDSWIASWLTGVSKPDWAWQVQNYPDTYTNADTCTNNGSVISTVNIYPHWSTADVWDITGSYRHLYFNDREQVIGSLGPTGLTTTNIYGSDGFLAKSIAFETKTTNTYTFAGGLLATRVDPNGLLTSYLWDGLERLRGIYYPDNTSVSNTYTWLDLTDQKDRLGNWTHAHYNKMRQMDWFTDRRGYTTYLGYCLCGGLETVVDPLTNSTTYNRNLVGWVDNLVFSDAGGQQTSRTFTRDALGRATHMADSSGLSLDYTYNLQNLATNISSAQGTLLAVNYDMANRPVTIQNAEGICVTNYYDYAERLTDRYFAAGISQHYYFTGHLLDYAVDGLGNWMHYGYDAAGRLTSTADQYNYNTNGFTYTPGGQIATLADGNGHVTSWTYDSYGRNTRKTDGNGVLVETNGYSVNGQLAAHWTPGKWLTRYTNDANGNLTAIAYSSGPGITAAYDALNRIKSMSDAVGASAFTYQNFGAFMGALASEDGPWAADTVTNTYGTNRKLAAQTLAQPTGSWTESFGYDSLLRLHTLTSTAGTFTYNYYGAGKEIQSLTLPGGNSIAETYDDAGQLLTTALKHGATVLDGYSYGYDANGNRTSATNVGNAYINYGYDNLGQLTGALGTEADGTLRGNENFGYQYDPAGNLAMRTNNTLIQSFTTDNANELVNVTRNNDLLTVAGSLTVSNAFTVNGQAATIYRDLTFAVTNGLSISNGYNVFTVIASSNSVAMTNKTGEFLPVSVNLRSDANGNLVWDGLHAYEFDCANELARVTVTNNLKAEFIYDGFGRRRIKKEFNWQSNQWRQTNEVHYIYDGMLVIQERSSNNVPLVTYTRGVDLSGSMQGAGGIGGLLARTDANGPAYYHADGNGNITMLINSNGTMQAKYLYDSFGNPLGMWGPLAQVNTIRFSSMETYDKAGIELFACRVYIPNLQRWLNRDPIGELGGLNLYDYVANNPINYVDPLGLLDYYNSPGSFLQPSGPVPYLEGDSWYGQLGSSLYNTIPLAANALNKINPFTDIGTGEGAASGNGNYLGMAVAGVIDVAGMVPGEGKAIKCVIGRTKDLKNLQPGERSLLDRLSPDLGSPKANWKRNAGVLRQEMNSGLPIRDASLGDSGPFLNAERNLLESHGWTLDKNGYWMPPTK